MLSERGFKRNAPLDQHTLLRRHPAYVFPLVVLIPLYAVRLSVPIRIFERGWDEVAVAVDAVEVAERERPVKCSVMDWPPEIDDLETSPQQSLYVLGRKVASHAPDGRLGSLVDMHERNGLSILGRVDDDFGAPAANGCADATIYRYRGSCAFSKLTVIEEDDAAGAGELLEQFDTLGVVLALYLFVVLKRGVLGGVVEILEPILVKGSVGVSAKVLDFDGVVAVYPIRGALAGGRISVDCSPCFGPVSGRSEVFESGIDESRLAHVRYL